jgi:tRNA pseudouridine55 synthase
MTQACSNLSGWLVVDKPVGPTSRAVLNQILRLAPRSRMGHAGTLDPLASGILVIAVGAATRFIDIVQEMPKSYRTRIRLGARSDTDDAQGRVQLDPDATPPTRENLDRVLASLIGSIAQVPPRFSAIKMAGRRAYDLARRGLSVDLPPRTVQIHAIRVLLEEWPFLDLEIDCGSGTYIRSLARDLGAALGCGGLVETLERTRIGMFTLDRAASLDQIQQTGLANLLLPLESALQDLPRINLDAESARRLQHGQRIPSPGQGRPSGKLALLDPSGLLLGLGRIDDQGILHPERIVPAPHIPQPRKL